MAPTDDAATDDAATAAPTDNAATDDAATAAPTDNAATPLPRALGPAGAGRSASGWSTPMRPRHPPWPWGLGDGPPCACGCHPLASCVRGWEPMLHVCIRNVWRCTQGPSASTQCVARPPTQGRRLARAGVGWGPSWTVLQMHQVCRPAGETDGISAPHWNKPSMKIIARVEIQIPEVCLQNRGCFNYWGNSLEPRSEGQRPRGEQGPRCYGPGMLGRRWWSCSEFSARCPAFFTWPSVPHAVWGKCQQTTSLWARLWLRAGVCCPN